MDEAERLCHRLIVMDHGSIIAEGKPRDLLKEKLEPEVIEVFGPGATSLNIPLALGLEIFPFSLFGEVRVSYFRKENPHSICFVQRP